MEVRRLYGSLLVLQRLNPLPMVNKNLEIALKSLVRGFYAHYKVIASPYEFVEDRKWLNRLSFLWLERRFKLHVDVW